MRMGLNQGYFSIIEIIFIFWLLINMFYYQCWKQMHCGSIIIIFVETVMHFYFQDS